MKLMREVLLLIISIAVTSVISAENEELFLIAISNLQRKPYGNLVILDNEFSVWLPKLSQFISYQLIDSNLRNLTNKSRNCILLSYNVHVLNKQLFSYSTCRRTIIYILTSEQIDEKFTKNQTNLTAMLSRKNSTNLLIKTPFTNYTINLTNSTLLKDILQNSATNLHGKPLLVTMFPKRFTSVKIGDKFTGFDGEILYILEKRLNFTIVWTKNDGRYGYKLPNGSFSGSLGDIVHGRADFTGNSLFIKFYGSDNLQFTTVVMLEELCVAAPASEMIPKWLVVFSCFKVEVWFGILLTFTVSGVLWHLLERNYRKLNDCSNTVLNIIKILLQLSIDNVYNKFWQRLYIISLIFGSMVFSKSLEGSLLDRLTKNTYKRELNTLEDLEKSSVTLYTLSANLQRDTFSQTTVLQTKFFVYENSSQDMVRFVNSRRDVAYLGRKFDLIRRIGEIRSKFRRIHIIEECPRSYNLAYMMRKDSYLYNPIEKLLSRLLEVGIIDYLQNKDINKTLVKNSLKSKKYNRKYQPFKLELQNLTVGLFVLFFGYLISFLVFISEIIFGKKVSKMAEPFIFIN